MTLTLPPLLELIGIVCGSIVAGMIAFTVTSIAAVLFMDTGEAGSALMVLRWPVAITGVMMAGWWLSSLS